MPCKWQHPPHVWWEHRTQLALSLLSCWKSDQYSKNCICLFTGKENIPWTQAFAEKAKESKSMFKNSRMGNSNSQWFMVMELAILDASYLEYLTYLYQQYQTDIIWYRSYQVAQNPIEIWNTNQCLPTFKNLVQTIYSHKLYTSKNTTWSQGLQNSLENQ